MKESLCVRHTATTTVPGGLISMAAERSACRRISRWFYEGENGLRFRFTNPYDASVAMIMLENYIPRNAAESSYKERAEEAMMKELGTAGSLMKGGSSLSDLMRLGKEVKVYNPSTERIREMLRGLDHRISEEHERLVPR